MSNKYTFFDKQNYTLFFKKYFFKIPGRRVERKPTINLLINNKFSTYVFIIFISINYYNIQDLKFCV